MERCHRSRLNTSRFRTSTSLSTLIILDSPRQPRSSKLKQSSLFRSSAKPSKATCLRLPRFPLLLNRKSLFKLVQRVHLPLLSQLNPPLLLVDERQGPPQLPRRRRRPTKLLNRLELSLLVDEPSLPLKNRSHLLRRIHSNPSVSSRRHL